MRYNPYEQIIPLSDIPNMSEDQLRKIIVALIQHLELTLKVEQTPDYSFYTFLETTKT